ncbi:magnesium and cobalt transport protein CorA [Leucobacter tenebrionis]|uniref:magnesium and cobalt transport protein CorA n=1 Tax=Leucobacter tenebrionis TaxID=2873270 RepID=UPI001CA627FD|nr:magnesium and cobalt transport protein CorA [Leucobacter tenebrionis]QZY51972.1 magnesium and cobalt transport protein CorA [Leucobacter tenebrionis]
MAQQRAKRAVRRNIRGVRAAAATGTTAAPILTRHIVDGRPRQVSRDVSLVESLAFTQADPAHMSLTVMSSPTPESIAELASAWQLHPLLVEDLLHGGQRPKLERYGDVLFLVLRSARYIDESEEVEFSEFHLLVRPRALVIVCQDGRLVDGTEIPSGFSPEPEAPLGIGAPLLEHEHLLRLGPEGMVYQLLDAIVDGYFPVLDGVQIDKEQIERQVFSGDAAAAARIYHLSQEVIDVLHSTAALTRVLHRLQQGADKYAIPDALQAYLQDVSDHLTRVVTETTELRDALSQILSVNATLVAQRQNEDMKKISGWAAILFAPTLIAAVYGMNFDVMPELHWAAGYPLAVGGMVGFAVLLYVLFKLKRWM